MKLLNKIVLRHRARQSVLSSLRFAERLRRENSEFAPSYTDTLDSIGDELATMSRNVCRNDAERRALLQGLMAAFQRMYQSNPALSSRIARRLAPKIMAAQTNQSTASPWMKIAV